MSGLLRFSGFELDLERSELRRAGRRVALPQQPFRALVLLATRAGQVVTREELRHALWPDGTHVDFERGINFCLSQVRTALRDPARASHFVETLPRIGYRFVADVHTVGTEPAAKIAAAPAPPAGPRRPWWAIAAVLALAGTTSSLVRPKSPAPPHDAAAQADYVRGLALLQRQDLDAWTRAAAALTAATVREPAHADAQAALARVLLGLADAGRLPAADAMARARQAALAALREDPRQADALVSLALVRLRLDWDWGAALDLDRATVLAPDLARAHRARAALLSARGAHEPAIRAATRAAELDPVCPTLRGDLGWYYYCARRFPEAAAQWRLSIAVQGDSGPRDRLVDAYRHERRTDEAWREAAAVLRGVGVPGADIDALARRGPEAAVREFLAGSADYQSRRGAPLERLAALYAAAGADERAEALLRRAADERSPGFLAALAVDPDFERLRGRPAYEELLRATGLGATERGPVLALLTAPHPGH
jgi:DNA-binding winged helix-turn-helix (wHTH) protein/tetratricopeptide (TPR) repeat protein